MARTEYILFVDEVKPTPPFKFYNFTGIVITKSEYENQFVNNFDNIKDKNLSRLGGKTLNLHFTDLKSKRNEFSKITKEEEDNLWTDIIDLFNNTKFNIISGIVNGDNVKSFYPHYSVSQETLAFKTLIQNYVRFLHINNGYGSIIIESSNDDDKLVEEFYKNKLLGGKYITSTGYSLVLRNIKCLSKNKLSQGLQLADFIANPISRMVDGMKQYKDDKLKYSELLNNKIFNCSPEKEFIYEYGVRKIYF